jgi:hypothetical protein
MLSRLEQFRGEADYNRFFVFTRQGATEEVELASEFCTAIEAWLKQEHWIPRS